MSARCRQRGFSLVPALFLLVVLAVLGAVAVRLSAVEHQTTLLGMQSTRAYAAARAGIEWSAYRAITAGTCGTATVALTEGGLDGFTVDTNCTTSSHNEGASTINVYILEAFAYSGAYGTPDYVSRRIRASVTDAT
ncbi:MAG: pilus assembly protein MshP [Gammaproteobacteria bacterium]|nr:pilus assembly protein MshP [Gammaproteobacteria bacterium]